jgi:hypothetical protein
MASRWATCVVSTSPRNRLACSDAAAIPLNDLLGKIAQGLCGGARVNVLRRNAVQIEATRRNVLVILSVAS